MKNHKFGDEAEMGEMSCLQMKNLFTMTDVEGKSERAAVLHVEKYMSSFVSEFDICVNVPLENPFSYRLQCIRLYHSHMISPSLLFQSLDFPHSIVLHA